MRAERPLRWRVCAATLAAIVSLSGGAFADDVADARTAIDAELETPFGLRYSVQPGETLLAPSGLTQIASSDESSGPVQHASFWQPLSADGDPDENASEEAATNVDSATGAGGLFNPLTEDDDATHWSTALDSAAEDRVDGAIRAAGTAVVLLGLTLVAFLGWHRLRGPRMPVLPESSQLLERGRLPITQTCRLHLVRAGHCDVLVAVDRGSVKAMTPLPADFSQLTAASFDSPADFASQ